MHTTARILLAGAFALALTSTAQATIVYVHDGANGAPDELRAMDDNGTNTRVLLKPGDIGERPTGGSGGGSYTISALSSASTHPAGDVVVFSGEWSGSYAEWQRWSPNQGISTACGVFCVGVYVLADGKVARLSPDPYGCPLNPCAMLETEAELAPDGSVALERAFANWASKCDGGTRWCDVSYQRTLFRRTSSEDAVQVKTACEDKGQDPAPNPVEAGYLVHGGCYASTDQGGQYYLSLTNGTDSFGHLWFDDWEGADPAWSPDGSQITVYESDIGQDPGIWVNTIPAEGAIQFRRAVVTTSDDFISSPRLTGDGKLIFVWNQNLFSVPASCNECALSTATQLTSDGRVDNGFGWTAATTVAPVATPTPSPSPSASPSPTAAPVSSATPTPSPAPPGGTGGTGGTATPPPAPSSLVSKLAAVAKRARARKGLKLRITLGKPAQVTAVVETLKPRRRRLGSVRFTGRKGVNTFTIRKVARRALKPGRYRVVVTVVDGGKTFTAGTLNFTATK